MAAYFTATNAYDRSTYTFEWDKNNLYVKQGTTTIATFSYTNSWLAVRTNGNDFEVGSLNFNPVGSYFTRTVDYSGANAGIIYQNTDTKIIGTSNTEDGGVTKQTYNVSVSSCPVKVKYDTKTNIMTMTCGCDPDNCTSLNSCYVQVN